MQKQRHTVTVKADTRGRKGLGNHAGPQLLQTVFIRVSVCMFSAVMRMNTWMRLAAGFLLFSKCFCRCCSCTFRAKPEPRMPYRQKHTLSFHSFITTFLLLVASALCSCAEITVIKCADVRLTAGRAKKEIPSRAKPADNRRPVHVCGVLSP